MISSARIKQARDYGGFTQAAFALELGIKQPTVAQIEAGIRQPSAEVLQAIARLTGFPLAFFRDNAEPSKFPLGSLVFRAHASTSQRERARVQSRGELVLEMASALSEQVDMLPITVRKMPDATPVDAAHRTRLDLRLPQQQPIDNLIYTIESAGVLVLALPETHPKVDALSAWIGRQPVIALLSGKPADRMRFSTAHELGHLVLDHAGRDATGAREEREADTFAAELLFPSEAAQRELLTPVTLTGLLPLKRRWRIALSALARRAHDVGVITDRQYRYLLTQISIRGWRKEEPNLDIPQERPRAVRQMAELVYGVPVDVRSIAADMRLLPSRVRTILEAHAGDAGTLADVPVRGAVLPLFPELGGTSA